MKMKINLGMFAGCVASERCVLGTRVYGCETESNYFCRTFILPLTPRVLKASDVAYADVLNR